MGCSFSDCSGSQQKKACAAGGEGGLQGKGVVTRHKDWGETENLIQKRRHQLRKEVGGQQRARQGWRRRKKKTLQDGWRKEVRGLSRKNA